METEREAGILTYRYVYGLEKAHVVIYGIEGGAGSISGGGAMSVDPDAAVVKYVVNEFGILELVSEEGFFLSEIMEGTGGGSALGIGTDIVKLYYHADRLLTGPRHRPRRRAELRTTCLFQRRFA